MISFSVEDHCGHRTLIEVPEGVSLSLMEILKGSDYDIMATCGGMALCATCLVKVLKGREQILPAGDAELDMLDTLPHHDENNRLSCQIRVDESLEGCVFKLP